MRTQKEFTDAIAEGKKLVSKDGQKIEYDPVIDEIWFCSRGFTARGTKVRNSDDKEYVTLLSDIGSKDLMITYVVGVFRINEWEVEE